MMQDFFVEKRPHNGFTYSEYIENWVNYLERTDKDEFDSNEKVRFETRVLNKQRSLRIQKTYKVSEELASSLAEIKSPQLWMVLTENWCGDSAQNLPFIAKMAEKSKYIDLRILERDNNLDIMDQYLTEGQSRSIPKLVAFDNDGNELFKWGPRPKFAQDFVKNELAKGREKAEVMKELHLWYARNKGEEIEKEFLHILEDIFSTAQEQ